MSLGGNDVVDRLMKRWSVELHRENKDEELLDLLVLATHEIVTLRESRSEFYRKLPSEFALQIKGFWRDFRKFKKASAKKLKSTRIVRQYLS